MKSAPCLICVDMGSTRTRGWVTQEETIWAHGRQEFGARDVASGKTRDWLSERLHVLIDEVVSVATCNGMAQEPELIAGAGMITSGSGLKDIPHLAAPVTSSDLARNMVKVEVAWRPDTPFLLVPGIRTGSFTGSIKAALAADVMRGEETLTIGLLEQEVLQQGYALLHLGSHWKWVHIGKDGAIASSVTSLTGEMIHALFTQSMIASALPDEPPDEIDLTYAKAGFEEARNSGLSRALFAVRMLELGETGTASQRSSFLYGAFVEGEMEHLSKRIPEATSKVVICGGSSLAKCWSYFLNESGMATSVLSDRSREQAYLQGLAKLISLRSSL